MAKIIGVDHMTFTVKNLEQRTKTFNQVFGAAPLFRLVQGNRKVISFELGGNIINFVSAPMDGTSFFADFLRKRGEALHHMGFSVDSLDAFKQGMAANGIKIPKWELEGNPEIRDEVLIGTKHIPTVFQIIQWASAPLRLLKNG